MQRRLLRLSGGIPRDLSRNSYFGRTYILGVLPFWDISKTSLHRIFCVRQGKKTRRGRNLESADMIWGVAEKEIPQMKRKTRTSMQA